MTDQTSLIDFPCDFSIKIIGLNTESYLNDIKKIVYKHYTNVDEVKFACKPSKNANYLAITATVHARSKPELDALYMDLTKHPNVKMAL